MTLLPDRIQSNSIPGRISTSYNRRESKYPTSLGGNYAWMPELQSRKTVKPRAHKEVVTRPKPQPNKTFLFFDQLSTYLKQYLSSMCTSDFRFAPLRYRNIFLLSKTALGSHVSLYQLYLSPDTVFTSIYFNNCIRTSG